MKRKIGFIVVLFLVVVGRTFAQFTIDGSYSISGSLTSARINSLYGKLSIGMGYEFLKFDLLAGVNFNIATNRIEYEDLDSTATDESLNSFSRIKANIGIYAGLAPKVSLSGKWSLSFPLLVEVSFDVPEITIYFNDSPYRGSPDTFFDFDFMAGARAAYAFSNHWSLYMGFLANIVSWTHYKDYIWRTSNPDDNRTVLSSTRNGFDVFNSSAVQLGVIYRFGPSKNNTGGSSEKTNDDDW